MLVFLVICCYLVMITALVRNALRGIQLSSNETYEGEIELLIPITQTAEFHSGDWIKSLETFKQLQANNLRIHILIDGHFPAMATWMEMHQKLPFVELHSFSMRPPNVAIVPWMIHQIAPQIRGKIVIIGDPEIVPDEAAFLSLAHHIQRLNSPIFVLPQTSRKSIIGESIAALHPTLALASVYGFKHLRKHVSNPLLAIAQGWIGMTGAKFKILDFSRMHHDSWKRALAEIWERDGVEMGLAYGEKHLLRHYPSDLSHHVNQMKTNWEELCNRKDRTGILIFSLALFVWFFPFGAAPIYYFWTLGTLGFLGIYRFFAKVIFQERWRSLFLHPFGVLVWLGVILWWACDILSARFKVLKHR